MTSEGGVEDTAADLERVSRGDPAAAERVLASWSPLLERYLRRSAARQLLQRESAADLAQSVCREALVRLERGDLVYRGADAMKKWLYGAADLKVRNRLRYYGADRRAREELLDVGDGVQLADLAPDPGPTPSGILATEEERAAFDAALAQLEERQREAVRLFHLEGQSHAEIAGRFGIAESHSRTLLARGLARLTRIMREG